MARRTKRKRHAPSPEPAAAAAVASVLGDDDLLAEILLRLDSPTWLVRAALVCRRWIRRASDPAFLRRFRALHPPRVLVLSVIEIGFGCSPHRLVPVPRTPELAAAARRALGAPPRSGVCDCRNGRLLIDIKDCDRTKPTTYAIRSLLRRVPDKPLPQPPPSMSSSLVRSGGICHARRRLLLLDDDAMSCLCLNLTYNDVHEIAAEFSILQSGVWGIERSAVTKLPQSMMDTMVAHDLLVGTKFYMMTTLGYILGLDLITARFFTVELPDEARNCKTLKLSRPRHSGLYLIHAKGFQLHVWHGDGLGQWALVDTISVRDACAHLKVRRWVPDDARTAPVLVVAAGDNAEFVFVELVASGLVCCIQLGDRAVEKVGPRMREDFICPIAMGWPPIFPVLSKLVKNVDA
ncbi:hypothetical protein ACP70R_022130 [Stipagrostis hirtigluma subsp. patula]